MNPIRTFGVLAFALAILSVGQARAGSNTISVKPEVQNPAGTSAEEKAPADELGSLYVLACLTAMAHGDTAKAEAACGKAIALDSGDADAYKLRGYAYLLEHRFERAEADFRVALKLRPKDPDDVAGLAQSFNGQGRFEEGVKQFAYAVQLAPGNAPYRNGLCWARAGTGKNLSTALADCNQALALAPDAPGILNSRGLVYLRMGQYQTAIEDYSTSLSSKPTQPSARFGRGLAHLYLGQQKAGVDDIAEARRGDADIDDMFVLLGVLPQACNQSVTPACPPGFPKRTSVPSNRPVLAVSLQIDPDAEDIYGIEIGRLELMVDQIRHLLRPAERIDVSAPLNPPLQALYRRLSATVTQFNGLLPAACATHRVPAGSCLPYHPTWASVIPVDLGDAIDDAYGHVGPVWVALCTGHKRQCRLE